MGMENNLGNVLWIGSEYKTIGLKDRKVLFLDSYKRKGICDEKEVRRNIEKFLNNGGEKPDFLRRLSDWMKNFFNLESVSEFWARICYANINNYYYSGDKVTMINKIIKETSPDIIIILGVGIRNFLINKERLSFHRLCDIEINYNNEEVKNKSLRYVYDELNGTIILNTYSPSYNDYKDYDRLALFTSICFDNSIYDKIIKHKSIKIKAEKIEDDKPFNLTLLNSQSLLSPFCN